MSSGCGTPSLTLAGLHEHTMTHFCSSAISNATLPLAHEKMQRQDILSEDNQWSHLYDW